MKVEITIDERDLRQMVLEHMRKQLPEANLSADEIKIEVKSKQNFRSEWESAAFRAVVHKGT